MADSQVDQDSQVQEQQQSGGLFSSGFSRIGAAMPSFGAMPWTPKNDDSGAAVATETQVTEDNNGGEQKGGFLSGVSGGFSKLTGNLPTVSAPSFGLPWGKKDEEVPLDAGASTATGLTDDAATANGDKDKAFLSGVSGGFSKLTGGLPSVSVPSFGLPWSKKDGETLPDTETAGETANGGGKSEFLSGVSGGFSKLTGGLPSVTVPSFGLPWGKKDGEVAAETDPLDPSAELAQGTVPLNDSGSGSGSASSAGLNKLSSAVTGIFGVFKTSDESASAKTGEDSTTPK